MGESFSIPDAPCRGVDGMETSCFYISHPGYTVFVFQIKGTRKFKCNSPVDCCLPPARRRQLLNVTSPFWRTKNSVSHSGYAIFDAPGGTRKGGGCVCSGLRLWQYGQWRSCKNIMCMLGLLFVSSPFLCLGFLPDFHYLYLIYTARNYRNQRKNTIDFRLHCNCE